MEFLRDLGAWNWFILGAVLMLLEVFAPGAFLLWFGFAAIATGLVALALDMSWQIAILLFLAFSVVAVFLARRFSPREAASDNPFLNRRAEALVGRILVLEEAIEAGIGRARVDDSLWRVTGPDTPAGTRVRVERVDGMMLVVSRAD